MTQDHRITVRLDEDLYDRLLIFAQGRSNGHTPEVSAIVREALAQYLRPQPCQTQRLTKRDTRRHRTAR